jgi:hypothetical protein
MQDKLACCSSDTKRIYSPNPFAGGLISVFQLTESMNIRISSSYYEVISGCAEAHRPKTVHDGDAISVDTIRNFLFFLVADMTLPSNRVCGDQGVYLFEKKTPR